MTNEGEGAVCELASQTLPPGKTFALEPFHVAAAAEASADSWSGLVSFLWHGKGFADYHFGDYKGMAETRCARGTTPSPGVGGTVTPTPTPRSLPNPSGWYPSAVAHLTLTRAAGSGGSSARTVNPVLRRAVAHTRRERWIAIHSSMSSTAQILPWARWAMGLGKSGRAASW